MSPRKAAVLREHDSAPTLREHLIASTARLVADRRTARLTVRDIAREARVAEGVLYNHFADKDELVALALHVHVIAIVDQTLGDLPQQAGRDTVDGNLRQFIIRGLDLLTAILPIFAGLLTQPNALSQFAKHAADGGRAAALRAMLTDYLRAEQQLGRIANDVNADAAATMIIGACHDLVLPQLLRSPQATVEVPAGFVDDLITAIWRGIAP